MMQLFTRPKAGSSEGTDYLGQKGSCGWRYFVVLEDWAIFLQKTKEMGQLTQGRGKWSSSHFLIVACVASIQLTAGGPTAAGYKLQLRVRPGLEMGSTALTFSPPLPAPAADLAQSGPLSPFILVLLGRSLFVCSGC